MPEIKRIELERDNDQGVHEVKEGERLEPVEPEPPGTSCRRPEGETRGTLERQKHDKEEFERATTPFPGG